MIANDVQHRNTKAWLSRFEAKTLELEAATPKPRPRLQQAKIDAARVQTDDLRAELADYEARRSRHDHRGHDPRRRRRKADHVPWTIRPAPL